jgi:hypothetical protein
MSVPAIIARTNLKDSISMSQPTKFSDAIKNATTFERGKILDSIKAAAPSLPVAELKTLIAALDAEVKAQQSKNSAKSQRLQRLQAAMENQDDPQISKRVNLVKGELSRLGYASINEISANGVNAAELHKRAKDAGWQLERITLLKTAAAMIGIVE